MSDDQSTIDEVMEVLREQINEDRTDELLDFLFGLVPTPFYLRPFLGIAKAIVDRMLPEKLLDGIEYILRKYA